MSFIDRLIEEKEQLDIKLEKLNSFLSGEQLKPIDGVQITLLNIQAKAMATYSQCLLERLVRLSEPLPNIDGEFTDSNGNVFQRSSDDLYEKIS
jgi:hypothetical protein